MRRYGLYDATRGLMTALAVGVAGLLLWVATQVGHAVDGPLLGVDGHRRGGRARARAPAGDRRLDERAAAPALAGHVPARRSCRRSSCAGWILMATQPGNGWHEGAIVVVEPRSG